LPHIAPAQPADLPEIARLVNTAYRSREGWTHEADLIDGQRTSTDDLERELSTPESTLIFCLRDTQPGPIQACVLLRDKPRHIYLGMLSVSPAAMNKGFGRQLLEFSEAYAQTHGADRVVMTVLHVRDELIAWYERRGYRRTGECMPFPHDNEGLGIPHRSDLAFIVLEKLLA